MNVSGAVPLIEVLCTRNDEAAQELFNEPMIKRITHWSDTTLKTGNRPLMHTLTPEALRGPDRSVTSSNTHDFHNQQQNFQENMQLQKLE